MNLYNKIRLKINLVGYVHVMADSEADKRFPRMLVTSLDLCINTNG